MSILRSIQALVGKRNWGHLPDAPDARDLWLHDRLGLAAPPPTASVFDPRVLPKDQSSTSSCTGQSTSQALRLAYLKQGIKCPEMSALFPYSLGRYLEGSDKQDVGASIRDVIKAIIKWGECDEAAWPFKVSSVNVHPNIKAFSNAYDRRGAKKYYRIPNGDVDAIRRAIAAGFPVVAGWQVSRSFAEYTGGVLPAQEAPYLGGHAICLGAYNIDTTLRLLNSWGNGWGEKGYATVSEAFVRQATDVWALEVV